MSTNDWRLAIDIGGTFTDIVLLDGTNGVVEVEKTLTTPSAPLDAVRTGVTSLLERVGVTPQEITAPIVHATTLVTNALIEGKTGKAGLVTTTGFGDTLLIRDEHRYDMYDLQIEFPEVPIPRHLTWEIDERTTAQGKVGQVPSMADLVALTEKLAQAEVESVAVCLINSYVNVSNERFIADHLRRELNVPVCISAEISPQLREYPRMITAACNAATMPLIGPYLEELQQWLTAEGFGGSVLMMLSNGGVVSADDAAQAPIRLVESGPAAGALAACWFASRMGEERLLAFDMGGTTAKATLIESATPELTNTFEVARMYRFKKGSGFPVSVPSVDLVEIGAGGGSLARVDQFGLLKVGPESAGAEPGPASYGQGGTVPAVTDVDVVLGMLDPAGFLGGDMPLDASLAQEAVTGVAEDLGLSMIETAAGVHEVVNQNMSAAARMHGVERGVDLRGVTVLAFGGAGPVHACGVADLLESDRVIFPVNASVLSAFGTLVSPVRIDLARSLPRRLDDPETKERDALLAELREEGHRVLLAAGVPEQAVQFRYGVDARYVGQGNEITLWIDSGDKWTANNQEVLAAFEAEYQRIYGLAIPDVDIEIVTWRLSASSDPTSFEPAGATSSAEEASPSNHRQVVFNRGEDSYLTPVYQREVLKTGQVFVGPAIVEERETTSVIRPGWTVQVDADGSLVATRGTK
jgi:N-methylhydantoinase A